MPEMGQPLGNESAHTTEILDCGDARLTTRSDRNLTVLTITGEIYASNVDDVKRRIRALVPQLAVLVVDLSRIDFIGVAGFSALTLLNTECANANVSWVLIPSYSVRRLLRVSDPGGTLPVVASPAEALRRVRSAIRATRPLRLVTPADE